MDIEEFDALQLEESQKAQSQEQPQTPQNGAPVVEQEYHPVAFEDEPVDPVESAADPTAPEPVVTPEVPATPPAADPAATPVTPEPDVNAINAQRRREQEKKDAIETERQKWLSESPEAQLARELSSTYNLPAEKLLEQIRESKLQKESTATGVPVDTLRQRDAVIQDSVQLRQENTQLKGDNWSNRMVSESNALQARYPTLTDQDLITAAEYMVKTLRNPDLPVEHVARIIHSGKMQQHDLKVMEQEIIARQSGRAGTALAPQGAPATGVKPTLSAAEKVVAGKMGLSDAEYLRWKI